MIQTEEMPMSSERKADQEINSRYLSKKRAKADNRFRKNAENYEALVKGFKNKFGLDIRPSDKRAI